MRLEGLLVDLRTADLAFDAPEATALLDDLGVQVGPELLGHLLTRTQGWAAGLRLAGMAARGMADPASYIEEISGRDDYIADYLMREVFDALDREWREFVVRIGVVEEVCADLAVALGGGPESAERLARLARENAFVHELGPRGGWYRLHPLLLDLARTQRIDGIDLTELHVRAAAWFRRNDRPKAALAHALAGRAWPLAGLLVESNIVAWVVSEAPTALLHTFESIPYDVVLGEPGLAIGLAGAQVMTGASPAGELLDAARAHVGAVQGRRRERHLLLLDLIDVGVRRWSGDLPGVLDAIRHVTTDPTVLGRLGFADWPAMRTLLNSNAGSAELWLGEPESAWAHLSEAVQERAQPVATMPVYNAMSHIAFLHRERGELRAAEDWAHRAIDGFGRIGTSTSPQARTAYLALVGVAIDRDRLEAAATWLAAARHTLAEPQTEFATSYLGACLSLASGTPFEALTEIRAALDDVEGSPTVPDHLVRQGRELEQHLLHRRPEDSDGSRETATERHGRGSPPARSPAVSGLGSSGSWSWPGA